MATFSTYKFIAEIKKRPALWNCYCEEYDNRKIKKKYWDEILEIFRDKEQLNPIQRKYFEKALKQRWKSIRGCFTRELKRQIILKSGGIGGYKTEYIHYKRLMFLKKVIALKVPPMFDDVSDEEDEPIPEKTKVDKSVNTEEPKFPIKPIQYLPIYTIEPENKQKDGDGMFILLTSALKTVPQELDFLSQMILLFTVDDTKT